MIGRTLGHYEITALIGRGGMGEVYSARDTRLKRDVALKILPAAMAADPVRLERFQREAEAVASLNHPHIVTLYSVEEADERRFITMELVEGQPLDAMLSSEGLPIAKVLEIGVAVADALAAAHEKGIVHRDLKPGNVMMARDGRIKVLDFGLAVAAPTDPGVTEVSPLTDEGTTVGTLPYMSPEQVRGERVDHRSDIFSLGAMLFQLTTGRLPFHGDYGHAIGYAIVNSNAPAVSELRGDVPVPLEDIITRCLEKLPARRYATAAAVRDELRGLQDTGARHAAHRAQPGRRVLAWAAAATLVMAAGVLAYAWFGRPAGPAQAPSIAVLPFVNVSSDKDQEYFSDGISDDLLNLLAQVRSLKVAARTSSFSFKGKDVEIPEIARELKVTHVLEGSVRKSGDRVRITAELIHASDGYQVWSHTYDRDLNDIFAVQDEIAGDVVSELKVTLLGSVPKSRKTDPQAYALYLQARELALQATPPALMQSVSLYQRALEIDPQFAPAWERLAANYSDFGSTTAMPFAEAFAKGSDAANRAIAIDPNYAPAYATLERLATISDSEDFVAGAALLEKALKLDPTDSYVLASSGYFLLRISRFDEAIAVLKFALERDPVNPTALHFFADALLRSGHYKEAARTFRTALSLNPARAQDYFGLGSSLLLSGDAGGALEAFLSPYADPSFRQFGSAMAYYALGKTHEADSALAQVTAKYEKEASYNIAWIYAFRGENDLAFHWLDLAVTYHDPGLVEIASEPLLNNLHQDPRWLVLLRTINRAPEQLAKIRFNVRLPDSGKTSS